MPPRRAARLSIMREPKTASASSRQEAEQIGQFFRRVLAVAVQQRDDIEPVVDGVAVT